MGDSARLRIPLLEGPVRSFLGGASFGARPLVSQERKLLLDIFGDSINLDPVEIAHTRLISKSTAAYTMGNKILIPSGTTIDASTLVHEMTHVWQFQTMGTRYISDSALHQMTQGSSAYHVEIVGGQSLYAYAAEQQAVIVQRYYDNPSGCRLNPDVVRMISEVRRARPLSSTEIDQETWFGPNRPAWMDTSPGSGAPQTTQTVPLIRIEF